MAATEAEVASTLEGSLALMLKSFNEIKPAAPSSSTPELPIANNGNKIAGNGNKKSASFAVDDSANLQERKLSKSAEDASHSVTPPMRIGSACLSHALAHTPKPPSKLVGTPADFRRHITQEEFDEKYKLHQNPANESATTDPSQNKEEPSTDEQQLPQTTQTAVTIAFTKVSLKKPPANTDASVVNESKPVEFKRTVGGF